MKSILDPSFKYIPSAQTDIRKTFATLAETRARERPSREDNSRNIALLFAGRKSTA